MEIYPRLLLYYLVSVNIVSFLAFGIDKHKACKKHWRISEAALIGLSLLGGSPAALFAMHLFRHKTQHKKFRYGVPLILIAQVALIAAVMCR